MFTNNKKPAPKSNRRCRLMLEQLEGRDVMTAPVVFSSIAETLPGLGSIDFANTPAATHQFMPTLPTSPVMESRVIGKLPTGADADVVKVRLEKDQIFSAYADFTPTYVNKIAAGAAPRLTLYNSAGQTLLQGPQIAYRVATTGIYFVGMSSTIKTGTAASYSAQYTLHVRPIGLGVTGRPLCRHRKCLLY